MKLKGGEGELDCLWRCTPIPSHPIPSVRLGPPQPSLYSYARETEPTCGESDGTERGHINATRNKAIEHSFKPEDSG